MKRIKYIFLNVVLSLQLIFASIEIPEDSFIRAGSCVSGSLVEETDGRKHCLFEITTTKSKDSVRSTESKDSDEAAPKSKKQKTEGLGLEVKNIEIPCKLVADPGYDQTFKRIFTWDNPVDGIKGEDRLMSLLNSIFYPNAGKDDFQIRKVEPLPNEVTKLDRNTALGVLKFDIACRCSCYKANKANEVKIFDVEMQTGYQAEFQDRLFDYGNKLRLENNHSPTIVLAFLNYKREEEIGSSLIRPFRTDLMTGCTKPLEDVLDTYSINLFQQSSMLKEGIPLLINRDPVDQIGKEWLKLLSIRHWATKNGRKYIIPDTAKDPTVKSAIKMLSCINEQELARFIEDEDFSNGVINTAKEEGKLEGLEEGKMKGKIETAKNMLQMELLTPDNIALATGLPIEQINALKDELEKSKEDNELEEDDEE